MTACGSIESAVAAMRQGAYDYLEKPFNSENLQITVTRAIDYHRALYENSQFKAFFQECFTFHNIITVNPTMKEMLEMAAKVTAFPQTTVAIYGESGTGKEVLARAIHFASKGLPGNFVAVNCAAIPEAFLESELFGHVRGAFTGADKDRDGKFTIARGGTVFLDEIGDMPPLLQAKLLRVLEERTYEKVGSNTLISAEFQKMRDRFILQFFSGVQVSLLRSSVPTSLPLDHKICIPQLIALSVSQSGLVPILLQGLPLIPTLRIPHSVFLYRCLTHDRMGLHQSIWALYRFSLHSWTSDNCQGDQPDMLALDSVQYIGCMPSDNCPR